MADGADVVGHVFARFAIAPRGGLHQHAVFVAQAHGQAIKLQLGHVVHRGIGVGETQLFADACVKGLRATGFGVGLGADAEHGHPVFDAGKAVKRLATHALGGRVGAKQIGVCRFERLKFFEQAVVFGVWDGGRVQHVVLVGVGVELFAQFGSAGSGAHARRLSNQLNKRRACGDPADRSRASSVSYKASKSRAIAPMAVSDKGWPLSSEIAPSITRASS